VTRIRFNEPPDPPDGRVWCVMCLMLAKNQITSAHPELAEVQASSKTLTHYVAWDTTIMLMPAMTKGISDVPQLGVVDVCWTHLAGIKVGQASPLVLGNGMPNGLVRGQG
jgi:hypothetical protein